LAEENLTLFLHCFLKGHPALQTIALQIITDVLITHPSLLAEPANEDEENRLIKPVLKAYSRSIKSGDPAVQSTGATALSKAMLSRLITEPDLLKQLVVAYFDPDTADNAQLRQSLSYFLPVYCHSRAENATRMVSIACPVIAKLATIREAFLEEVADAEEEEDGMVKLSAVGNMLLDWTDPRKIFGFAEAAGAAGAADGASETHYFFAESILEKLVTSQVSKEEKKVLFSVLGRLHMPVGGCYAERLKTVLELCAEAVDTKVASDATSRNVLTKLQTQLLKQMHDVMTLERGGGGAEETVVDSTELAHEGDETEATVAAARGGADTTELGNTEVDGADDDEEDEEEDADVTQLRTEMKDTTLGIGSTTIGAPDAEGTRVVLDDEEDSEMLDDTDPMDTTA
jgi:condensin complex subunit 3